MLGKIAIIFFFSFQFVVLSARVSPFALFASRNFMSTIMTRMRLLLTMSEILTIISLLDSFPTSKIYYLICVLCLNRSSSSVFTNVRCCFLFLLTLPECDRIKWNANRIMCKQMGTSPFCVCVCMWILLLLIDSSELSIAYAFVCAWWWCGWI